MCILRSELGDYSKYVLIKENSVKVILPNIPEDLLQCAVEDDIDSRAEAYRDVTFDFSLVYERFVKMRKKVLEIFNRINKECGEDPLTLEELGYTDVCTNETMLRHITSSLMGHE